MSRTQRSASSAVHRGAQTQNRENNPMQSRMGPGSQRSCGLRPGHEKKNGPSSRPQPNLIPLWSVETWMPGTSSAKTRFALLPGHDEFRHSSRLHGLHSSQTLKRRIR